MRYVILRHETPPGSARSSHWDLMFDVGEGRELRTWAVEQLPDLSVEQDALALPDHRREYLTYEGPVSGDHGSVTRWDEGTYALLPSTDETADSFVVRVAGRRMNGTIEITAAPQPRFCYRPERSAD